MPLDAPPCLICGSRDLTPALQQCRDLYLGLPAVVDYATCRVCGLTQQSPVPDSTAAFYLDYPIHVPKSRLFSLARKLLIRRVYFAPSAEEAGCTLLDFGCGDGAYLETVEGRVARRLGFEPSATQAAAVSARLGIPVASDLADDTLVPDGSVDLVTSHFVLEHLTDLRGTFAYWHRKLKPGGTLHLAVPNLDCFEARLFGKRWHGLDAPRHISFPAGASLARLAEGSGFRILRSGTGVFPNTWAASLVAALLGRHHQGLFLLAMPLAFLLATLMPQSTAVYLLKKDL